MKVERIVGYTVVVAVFIAALAVLIPWNGEMWNRAVTTHTFTYNHPHWTRDVALASITARMDYIVHHRDNLDTKTMHDNLVFVNELGFGEEDVVVGTAMRDLARMNMDTFERQTDYKKRLEELSAL